MGKLHLKAVSALSDGGHTVNVHALYEGVAARKGNLDLLRGGTVVKNGEYSRLLVIGVLGYTGIGGRGLSALFARADTEKLIELIIRYSTVTRYGTGNR